MEDRSDNTENQFEAREGIIREEEIVRWQNKAEEYVDNPERTENLLNKALIKAEDNKQNEGIKNLWDKIQLLFSLVKDWTHGDYRKISKTAILTVIGGLIYFVTPIDVIPDFLVGLGLVDDAAILGLIINQLDKELVKYKSWKNNGVI